MPTVIDELVLKLGIDASKFRTDADKIQGDTSRISRAAIQSGKALEDSFTRSQQATDRRLRQGEEVGRQSSLQFSKFRKEAAALLATLATGFGIKQFVSGLLDADLGAGRLATRLGISTRELGAWQEASKRTGGSAQATGAAMEAMRQDFENWKITSQSAMLPWLQNLHVEWRKADGSMRDIGEIYKDIANSPFGKMNPGAANAIGSHLAMDPGLVALLQRKDLTQLLAQMTQLGVLTDAQFKAEEEFNNKILDIKQSFIDLGREILTDFLPDIEEVLKRFRIWYDSGGREIINKDIHEIAVGIGKAGAEINAVVTSLGGWQSAFSDLAIFIAGAWLALMMTGLGPIVTAIAAISAGFYLLKTIPRFADPNEWSPNSIFWGGMSKEEQLKYHDSPESRKARGEAELDPNSVSIWHPTTWFGDHKLRGAASDERKATVRDRLAQDLGISKQAASGIVAPLNAESNIAGINEINPTVPGSRGGFGWAQWTGPRRDAFEAYARQKGLDPKSDDANYGFLVEELRTKYPAVLAQLRRGDISATEAANIVTRQYIVPGVPGQGDFESKVQNHVAGAEDVSHIDLNKKPTGIMESLGHWMFGDAQKSSLSSKTAASHTSSTDVSINTINITTQAKDANSIASVIADRLHRAVAVNQADRGLA